MGFPGGSAGQKSACNAGDLGSIPGLGRSPGDGKGYPLQYSGLENSTDCIVHGVTKSRIRLSNFHVTSMTLAKVKSKLKQEPQELPDYLHLPISLITPLSPSCQLLILRNCHSLVKSANQLGLMPSLEPREPWKAKILSAPNQF